MPSIYRSGGQGGGSIYRSGGGRSSQQKRPSQKELDFVRKHGGGNIFENAVGDLRDITLGGPAAVKGFAEAGIHSAENLGEDVARKLHPGGFRRRHPKKKHDFTLADIGAALKDDYAHRWGPLLHGDIKTWADRFEDDPIFDIIDILTVASAGVGGAAKAGLIKSAPRELHLRLPSGELVTRPVVGTELSRRLRIGAQHAASALLKNEHKRAAKVQRRGLDRANLSREARLEPYLAAEDRLSKRERIAINLHSEYVSPKFVKQEAERLRAMGELEQARLYSDPKVLALVKKPSARMQRVLDMEDRWVAPLRQEIFDRTRGIPTEREQIFADVAANPDKYLFHGTPSTDAAMSIEQHGLDAGTVAGRWKDTIDYSQGGYVAVFRKSDFDKTFAPRGQKPVAVFTARDFTDVIPGTGKRSLEGGDAPEAYEPFTQRSVRAPLLGDAAREQRRWLPLLAQRGARVVDDELVAPEGKTIPDMIEELRSELGGTEPRYRPQKMQRDPGTAGYGAGGSVEQRSPIRRNSLQLWAAGKIARSIDTLGPNTMRLLRYALYSDKHRELVRGAKPVAGEVVDGKQWVYVKRHRNEKIGHMEQNKAGFEAELDEALKSIDLEDPGVSNLGNEMTTLDPAEAAVDATGNRLVVPVKYKDAIIGDFQRNNAWWARALRDTTSVWRALVLNLRVGWIVNNVVGNTFLFAVKSAGIGGLRAYWQEVLNSPGGKLKAHRMLSDPMIRGKYSPEFWAENFGDQVLGTFFGTQTPEAGAVARLLNSKYSPSRYTRQFDVGYEKRMRKAMVDVYIKRNPVARKFYNDMPKQTRSWEAAARKGFENDPQLAARISQQVNDALGDFLHMSDFEKKILRGAAPFYGWYQAIVKIMFKMPFDSPFRTAIIANMDKIGMEWTEDFGLPWLEGAIPLDDKGLTIGTQAMNPYSTPYSLGRAAVAGDWYAARQREGMLHPFIPMGARIYSQRSLAPLVEFGRGLPEARLAFPQERASYSTDPYLRELLSYFGVPIKRVRDDAQR